jgi:hypothetical protein
MLLAERIVLLLIDPQRGELRAPKRTAELDVLCAAALLTELVAQLRVQAQGGRLVAAGGLPASHPLLDRAHVCLGRHAMPASQAIAAVLHGSDSLPQRLCDGLYRRDLLHREWRFWRGTRYPLRSLQGRNECVARLHAAATRGGHDVADLGLLMLMEFTGALADFLPAAEYERASASVLKLGEPHEGNDVLTSLSLLRAALLDE